MRPSLTSLPVLARARAGAPLPDLGWACARRGSPRFGRRGGGGRPASGPYTPSAGATNLLWWHTTDVSGSVASWSDRIAGLAATQGTAGARPTQSNTAIAGAYPGVSFDGGDLLQAAGAGAVLNGKTALAITFGWVDSDAALNRVIFEYGATGGNVAGGFSIMANAGGGGTLTAFLTNTTLCQRDVSDTLATAAVWTVIIDGSQAAAVRAIRKNGVAQALAGAGTITPTWTAISNTLNFGNRAAGTLPVTGVMGDKVICNAASATADVMANETYVGSLMGLSI